MSTTRFTWPQLLAFRDASRDANPLHTDPDYARRTHFGGPVVFGALCGLRTLATATAEPGQTLETLDMEFRGAAFPDIDYQLSAAVRRRKTLLRLSDGPRLLTRVVPTWRTGVAPQTPTEGGGDAGRTRPATGGVPADGTMLQGTWSPPWRPLAALSDALGLERAGASTVHAAVVAFSSYLVGMEIPGERALFWRVRLSFPDRGPLDADEWHWQATVEGTDPRFALTRISALVADASGTVATLQLEAFERHPPNAEPWAGLEEPHTPELTGRNALVVGASRGLGAALTRGLALHGATVLGGFRSAPEAAAAVSAALPPSSGGIRMLQGDGTDPDWCARAVASCTAQGEGLDLLVLNASPALRSLDLVPGAIPRIQDHVRTAIALVAQPLAAALPMLDARKGTVVLVSSVAVSEPPPDWGHYAAAKAASEAMIRAASAAHPELRCIVLRPPRLDTGFTHNAALADAMAPAQVVRGLMTALRDPTPGVRVVDTF